MTDLDAEREPAPLTPAGEALRHGLWHSRSPEEFDDALGELFFEGPDVRERLWRFASLIVLSSAIAGFGLLANSAGVVIGAMLVAPLMTPIQALGAALVQGSSRRIVVSAAVILGGVAGAIATGYVVSLIGGGGTSVEALPSEIVARTAPGLLDLAIAVSAGAAGGYVIARPAISSALPGVGIAVALVPPLATVGICLELGQGDLARGALLLFTTNLAAIVLASAVMIFAAGFRAHDSSTRRTRLGFAFATVLVLAVAIPLAAHTKSALIDSRATRTVDAAIPIWDPLVRVVTLHVDDLSDRVSVELVVTSTRNPVSVWELARLLRDELGKPVDIELRVQLEAVDRAISN
jgi:uncharacterized hydrophobic protein (TIGR00271 family)